MGGRTDTIASNTQTHTHTTHTTISASQPLSHALLSDTYQLEQTCILARLHRYAVDICFTASRYVSLETWYHPATDRDRIRHAVEI